MLFSSILFLCIFLPLVLIAYHTVGHKFKNYVLLVSSLVFYAWGAPKFVFLLLVSLTINFYVVRQIHRDAKHRQLYLWTSVLINIGLLAYFKYANFFIENVNALLEAAGQHSVQWTSVALPIGISFFTFQSMTYTIDVYRKVHAPLKNIADYFLYILMFPQLIAGPIVRFNTVADDIIDRRKNESINEKLHGMYRFVIGLSKKMLIANVLGEQVDAIYSLPHSEVTTTLAWLAALAYSFQIYFDFSGYSDMAIGLGRIFGFKFPENFNNPYISQNITEFWRRWHITLSDWMRDYLYIPLGGNRVETKMRLYVNLITVFLISGLWHGASWNFVIWGAWHGSFLILDRVFLIKLFKGIGKLPRVLFTYLVVIIGWVIFRVENIPDIRFYFGKMFSADQSAADYNISTESKYIMILAALFSIITLFNFGKRLQTFVFYTQYKRSIHIVASAILLALLVINLSAVTSSDFNPFIYFRF
ncbi:MBOAT family O-acyltransferase [Draconibacterium halophilum]|uniref:MBOAT family protein n=1 Tax=Draconibacterium halophilum TaxID=2706887 RepID=A0A6C0RHW6_9BACT|nr:MBOAT family O-acyltransferase [Draconibacterium halophilum]QIA09719.1 MBOAT family protein [Draconibacterium halophilum]